MSDSDLIEAYLARRAPTRIAEGARATTEREWYAARREDRKARAEAAITEQEAINQHHLVYDHHGVEHCRNGLGEWIY